MEQQNFNQQNYNYQAPNNGGSNGKALSITSLVLGIVAIALFWVTTVNIVALACGIVSIVLAVMGKKKAVASGNPTGLATAGLVLGIIGTALAAIGFFTCTLCVICAAGELATYAAL